MPRFLSVAMLLLVAGCGQQSGTKADVANEAAAKPAADAAPAAVPALTGGWQLTKVDGASLDPGSQIAATFEGGKVRVAAGCNRRVWTFTQDRNIVAFVADPSGSANCQDSPSAEQEAAFHAIERATMAIFSQQGREANLSGNGGNVTLERR